jgi:hypothetical protein
MTSPIHFLETHLTRTLAISRFRERFLRSGVPLFGIIRSVTPDPLGTLRLREPRGGRAPEETAVPTGFLSDAERGRLDGFPAQVLPGDIETHFTLSRADRRQVPTRASPANRLGFALQLGALRFLVFCPDDLGTAPRRSSPSSHGSSTSPRAS